MSTILEGIFKGFIQWIYSLFLEIVQYIANSLLDVFQMDLDYFRQVAPVSDDILKIMIAVGWALLLGNLVFQAIKSMSNGLGFEGEDPKLLFTRTFVFAFLLLVSPEICEIGIGISSQVIQLLQMPTSVTITIPDENNFSIGASWLLIIIIGFVIMWQFVKLCFEVAERYVVTALLVLMAPLAFGMGGSKNTEDIFKGWCRMFGSMCVMMVLNVVFLKLLISALGYVPSGVAVLPWMLLIVGIARVARKVDSIVARMGLNPAITGDGLGRGLPGMVAYAVVKGIASSVAKAAGASVKQARGGSAGGKSSGPRINPHGPASPPPPPPSGGSSGGSGGASASAGMGSWKGQQADTRSTVSGGTFASQQQGQETVRGAGAVSQEDGHTTGTDPQTGQHGPVKAPTIHTHGTRRSSVPPKREQEPAQPDPIRPPMPVQPVPMTNNLRVRLGETGGQRPAAGHSAPSLPSHPIKEQQENPAVQAWLRQAAPEYLPSLRARVLTPNPAMFRIPAAGRLCGSASRSSRIGRRRYLPRKGLPVEISRMAAHLQRPSPIHPPGIRFMRLAAVLFLRGKSPPVRLWAGGSIRIVAVSLHPAWQECGRPPAAAVHPVVMQFPPVQQERVFTPEAGLF